MIKRDGAYTRSERIKELHRFFSNLAAAQKPEPLPFRRTMAMFQMNTGLTKQKIREYLQVLEDLGEIIVDEKADQIRVNKI